MTPNQMHLTTYEAGNQGCTRIVLADPERYPGIMQEWALLGKSTAAAPAEKELAL